MCWPSPSCGGLYPGAQGKGTAVVGCLCCGHQQASAMWGQGDELAAGVGDITTEAAAVPTVGRGCHRGPGPRSGGGSSLPPCPPPTPVQSHGHRASSESPGERHGTTSDLWWSWAELQAGGSRPRGVTAPVGAPRVLGGRPEHPGAGGSVLLPSRAPLPWMDFASFPGGMRLNVT